jgi:hypothetical protein
MDASFPVPEKLRRLKPGEYETEDGLLRVIQTPVNSGTAHAGLWQIFIRGASYAGETPEDEWAALDPSQDFTTLSEARDELPVVRGQLERAGEATRPGG